MVNRRVIDNGDPSLSTKQLPEEAGPRSSQGAPLTIPPGRTMVVGLPFSELKEPYDKDEQHREQHTCSGHGH